MPEETIRAFQDHGRVSETLTEGMDDARRLFAELEEAGVDYADVVATLERQGIDKFSASFAELARARSGQGPGVGLDGWLTGADE